MIRITRPLAPMTFLRRNTGKTVPLLAVISLAVMLVQSIIALINSIPLSIRTIYRYTDTFLGVSPRLDPTLTPVFVKELTTNPPVPIDRVILCRGSGAQVKSIVGKWPFAVMGFDSDDLDYYLKRQHVQGIEGRKPIDGKPEMMVSEPVAKNLGAHLGSIILKPDDSDNFSRQPVKLVGILKTDRWLMVSNKKYFADTQPIPIDFALIFTKDPAQQKTYDQWAVKKMKGKFAQLFAYHEIEKQSQEMFEVLYSIIDAVIGILVLVISIMMGMLMNIYQTQRLVEFGLLQAIGLTKRQLFWRVLSESVIVIMGGWVLGLIVSRVLLVVLKHQLMDPHAFALDVSDPMALGYTIPVPFAILIIALATIWLRFRKFDPVAVVERRIV
ncbi:MAG: FtsX-like permease family protein [Armatimonadetes bacterium]|nr:FtsX-like permease family protein [Armatimonadota bacterium]MBS1728841.1 FtsX-like permease family protein [Armatimonadota bacterium]